MQTVVLTILHIGAEEEETLSDVTDQQRPGDVLLPVPDRILVLAVGEMLFWAYLHVVVIREEVNDLLRVLVVLQPLDVRCPQQRVAVGAKVRPALLAGSWVLLTQL